MPMLSMTPDFVSGSRGAMSVDGRDRIPTLARRPVLALPMRQASTLHGYRFPRREQTGTYRIGGNDDSESYCFRNDSS